MTNSVGTFLRIFSLLALVLVLPSCTVKATIKQTTDTTSNVTGTTSGKSWITGDGLVRDDQKAEMFTTLNFDHVKRDMALGGGEYLASLGALLGIPENHQEDFFTLTQEHYATLIRSDEATPVELLAALDRTLIAQRIPTGVLGK